MSRNFTLIAHLTLPELTTRSTPTCLVHTYAQDRSLGLDHFIHQIHAKKFLDFTAPLALQAVSWQQCVSEIFSKSAPKEDLLNAVNYRNIK